MIDHRFESELRVSSYVDRVGNDAETLTFGSGILYEISRFSQKHPVDKTLEVHADTVEQIKLFYVEYIKSHSSA